MELNKMKPFSDYDLSQIIANQWLKVHKKIDSLTNEEIMGNELAILAENIYQEFYIAPVSILEEDFSKRSIRQGKIQRYVDPFLRDYYGKEYVEIDGVRATFSYPYHGEKELFKCRASTFSLGGYPEISVQKDNISITIEKTLNEMEQPDAKEKLLSGLERSIKEIKDGISYANSDVNSFNQSLKSQALTQLTEKKKKVESYYSIAQMFEVPVEKKNYAERHIPLTRSIVPISHKYEAENYYGITDKDYKDVLSTLKHTASTYERTPSSYKSLHEEDLRNTLLAALNATYKGDATGETFRNAGKTDIRCVSPVCTYKKDTMLCDVSNAKMILEYGWLSYSTMFDRKIRVGESFTTKICYHKDCIVSGMMSSIMFMCLEDCNNRFWNQPLFAPNNKIYDSYEITYKEYKDEYLPDSAIECFKKPWLW